MRLDVRERGAFGGGNARDGGDLVQDKIFRFPGSDVQFAAAEARQIGKAGMGPDRDAVGPGQPDRRAQYGGITGMKAGRDVRRRNRRHEGRVVAERVRPERLADVGVEIDPHGKWDGSRFQLNPT